MKIRQSQLGSNNNNAKAVKCYNVETNKEIFFETLEECKRFLTKNIIDLLPQEYLEKQNAYIKILGKLHIKMMIIKNSSKRQNEERC